MTTDTKAPVWVMSNDAITVVKDGKLVTTVRGASNFNVLRDVLTAGRWDELDVALDPTRVAEGWSGGALKSEGGTYVVNGQPLPGALAGRVGNMAAAGEDPGPVLKFWERLQKNPSKRSVDQLWGFLQHVGIPLTKDGTFLAYKGVRSDYKDMHTGTIDNSPGATPSMPRNQISDDPNKACHEGLHVGAIGYAGDFGPRVVICEVDPADVVCVPYDASHQKMRVCAYKVVGNYSGQEMPSSSVDEEFVPTDETDDYDDEPCEYCDSEVTDDGCGSEGCPNDAPIVRRDTKDEQPETSSTPTDLLKLPAKFKKYAIMTTAELLDVPLDELRRFASQGLRIVGASKILGGKLALVDRIRKVLST